MESKNVSKKLLMRLPVYLNYVKSLPENVVHISATQIANVLGLGDVLVRKDLAKVSNGGRRKVGYQCRELIYDIEKFLDINSKIEAVVVGAGRLGQALMDYKEFSCSGLNVLAGFDVDPEKKRTYAGKSIYPVSHLEDFIKENHIRIGIITVPAVCAQSVAEQLISCGVEAIWNFAPVHLTVPENVFIRSERLEVSLATLRMQLKN